VDREHNVLFAVARDDVVVGNADGQRALFAVVDVAVAALIVGGLETIRFLRGDGDHGECEAIAARLDEIDDLLVC
jgi:hypothetical protein